MLKRPLVEIAKQVPHKTTDNVAYHAE